MNTKKQLCLLDGYKLTPSSTESIKSLADKINKKEANFILGCSNNVFNKIKDLLDSDVRILSLCNKTVEDIRTYTEEYIFDRYDLFFTPDGEMFFKDDRARRMLSSLVSKESSAEVTLETL
jgi:hypothetical protein